MADGSADPVQWIITLGMAIGAGIVGAVIRSGWKSNDAPSTERGFEGMAQIADMQPVRDLVKQIDVVTPRLALVVTSLEGLATQQGRTASAIEKLVMIVEERIENEDNERDNEEEVRRRVNEVLAGKEHKDAIRREVRQMRARETAAAKKRQSKATQG